MKIAFNQHEEIVTGIQRILTKNRQQTTKLKLTFNTEEHPLKIFGTQSHDVHPCNAPYTRCNFCQEHGHRTDRCQKTHVVCPHCSANHGHHQCRQKGRFANKTCANCFGNHGASSLDCPVFLQHKLIIDNHNRTLHTKWLKRVRQSLNPLPNQTHFSNNKANPVVIHADKWPQPRDQSPGKNVTSTAPSTTVLPTPTHTHSECIKPEELKHILLDILELKTDHMDREERVTLIENVVNNNAKRCKSPTHLSTPNVSPVLIQNYPNIPKYQPTSTPNSNKHPYSSHTPNRHAPTAAMHTGHTGPKPHTSKHTTFNINTS